MINEISMSNYLDLNLLEGKANHQIVVLVVVVLQLSGHRQEILIIWGQYVFSLSHAQPKAGGVTSITIRIYGRLKLTIFGIPFETGYSCWQLGQVIIPSSTWIC